MTQEEKYLLLRDLCARLPYDVMVDYESHIYILNEIDPACKDIDYITVRIQDVERLMCAESVMIENIKPYLFPLSSMTEEQKKGYRKVCELDTEILSKHPMDETPFPALYNSQDWLNKNHFDYRGLIPIGLANDATGLSIY